MRRILFWFLALSGMTMLAFAVDDVTFRVDMNQQITMKRFDPAQDSVYVRGDFMPGQWWNSFAFKLTDANSDGIFEGTYTIVPPKKFKYKFVVRGPVATLGGDGARWEENMGDRVDSIAATPAVLPKFYFENDSTTAFFDNDITFRVDMRFQMQAGQFVASTDSVIMRGEVNGWGGKASVLKDADGDSIYTGTFKIPSVKKFRYKFVKIRPAGDGWESSPDRTAGNLTGPTTLLPVVFFNNYTPNGVTFRVNMNQQITMKRFDPAKDTVYVRGDFLTGPGNWWESYAFKLIDPEGDGVFEGMYNMTAPKKFKYKFVVRGPVATLGGDGARWEENMGDRVDSIAATPAVLPKFYFENDSTTAFFDNDITFRVNMSLQIKNNQFKPATDSVIMRGEVNGWGGKASVLKDADGDSIYTGTFKIPSVKKFRYKFVKIPGDVWESSPDRTADSLKGPTTILPIVFFNNISMGGIAKDEMVLTYELNQNFPNPFNPTTTIKYSIPNNNLVTLKVFNILGQEVATLVNAQQNAGRYEVQLDGTILPSGVYIYRVEAGTFVSVKKMMLLK